MACWRQQYRLRNEKQELLYFIGNLYDRTYQKCMEYLDEMGQEFNQMKVEKDYGFQRRDK